MGNYPEVGGDSSKPILPLNLSKGDKGDPAVVAIAQPWHLALPCDDDGSNVDYTSKTITIMVIQANIILANGGTTNGWSMTVSSQTDCTVSVSLLTADVDAIAANHAWFTLKLSHSSYNDLYITVKVSKIHKGEKGDTGDTGGTGGTGSQGIQGIQGNPGTGLVMVKKTIKLKPQIDSIDIIADSGTIQCTSDADHDLVLGEYVHLYAGGGAYDDDGFVTEVVSAKIWKMDITYDSPQSDGEAHSWEHFKLQNTAVNQYLQFKNIFPRAGKRDEICCILTKGDNEIMYFDIGYWRYPAAGYNSYAAAQNATKKFDPIMVNLWDKDRPGYVIDPILTDTTEIADIQIRAVIYDSGSKDWLTDFIDHEWQLTVSYKYFDFPAWS